MGNLVVGGIIVLILALAITKIVIEKRKGVYCVGCPHGGTKKTSDCGCDTTQLKTK